MSILIWDQEDSRRVVFFTCIGLLKYAGRGGSISIHQSQLLENGVHGKQCSRKSMTFTVLIVIFNLFRVLYRYAHGGHAEYRRNPPKERPWVSKKTRRKAQDTSAAGNSCFGIPRHVVPALPASAPWSQSRRVGPLESENLRLSLRLY